jgi:sigma-E factor negative regulatory protein RseC
MSQINITHPGIVKSINNNKAEISIIVNSGCASCAINGSCSLSEIDVKEKIIQVTLTPESNYKVGQHVTIEMKQSMGSWAVLLGYFFPFLFVLIGLIVFISLGIDQGISALLSIGLLIPYYLVLYLTRHNLQKKFTYTIGTN